jgi:hypothetical protein
VASSCSLVAGNNALAKEPFSEQRSRAFYPSHCPADPLEMNWFALSLHEVFLDGDGSY